MIAVASNSKSFESVGRSGKQKEDGKAILFLFGRDDRIRTCDFYVPNVALYQTEPHLVISAIYYIISARVCQQIFSKRSGYCRRARPYCDKKYLTLAVFCCIILKYICPWHSWIARQTPTLKAVGSNPIGQAKETQWQLVAIGFLSLVSWIQNLQVLLATPKICALLQHIILAPNYARKCRFLNPIGQAKKQPPFQIEPVAIFLLFRRIIVFD